MKNGDCIMKILDWTLTESMDGLSLTIVGNGDPDAVADWKATPFLIRIEFLGLFLESLIPKP